MTIGELIAELQKYSPDTGVVVSGYEGGYDDLKQENIRLVDLAIGTCPDMMGQHYEWGFEEKWRPSKMRETRLALER